MKKIVSIIIILVFLLIDWLIFHDITKPGEQYTIVEYLTGMISVPTIIVLSMDLVHLDRKPKAPQEKPAEKK